MITVVIVSSCSSKFSINKRRYLKGYHVDFVKNSRVKTKTSEETSESKSKTYTIAKKTANENDEVSIATTKQQQVENKTFLKLLNNKKDTRILHPNNYLCNTSNKRIISNNIIRPLINKYQTPNVSSKSQSASDGGGILVIFYILSAIGSIIALVYMFFIIASALLAVGVPMSAIGVLVGIAVLILLGIGVLLYLNKD
ncbi:MAG: hypothetical protein WCH21_04050 [Bacteroidota bacterium]